MSNNKKSFLVYFDLEDQIEGFTNEQVGSLFRAMLAFARRGEEVPLPDNAVKTAFRFVKVSIREDQAKYEKKCRQNAENGAKGGRPRNEP